MQDLLEELLTFGCRTAGEVDAAVQPAPTDGCAPDDFYSTSNHRTWVRHGGQWLEVERQRMDAAIVIENGRAVCRKLRDLRAGDPSSARSRASASSRSSASATATALRS